MRKRTPELDKLRRHSISATLFQPTSLGKAIARLGFVQADPIRSPARAQDLILRHRVVNYRVGDLDRHYRRLRLEEDFLYAYGFMPRSLWQVLHPRNRDNLTVAEREVFEIVTRHERVHPRELEHYFGREREINAWGSYSNATTRTLEALHYRGLLRVAGRDKGIRLYEPAPKLVTKLSDPERLRKLVLLIAAILSPVPVQSLRSTLRHLAHAAPGLDGRQSIIPLLLKSGELESIVVDGMQYVWPADKPPTRAKSIDAVRFLAPFDPLVWDRRRFEHLWGWPYRFEAYTPAPKRKLGYYALPILWREQMIGWVNISNKDGLFKIVPGFVAQPADLSFRSAFDSEIAQFRLFMQQPAADVT